MKDTLCCLRNKSALFEVKEMFKFIKKHRVVNFYGVRVLRAGLKGKRVNHINSSSLEFFKIIAEHYFFHVSADGSPSVRV